MKKEYFFCLDGLRAIAALLVIIHHTEQLKYLLGVPNSWDNNVIRNIGANAVYVFFVLSGFLITNILLKEIATSNTINIKKFYIRRTKRILPLYFLITLIGFFIITPLFSAPIGTEGFASGLIDASEGFRKNFGETALWYLGISPNIALLKGFIVTGASQTWSIGYEEHFYLFWPLIVFLLPKKGTNNIARFLIIMALFGLIARIPFQNQILIDYWNVFRVEYILAGALVAYLLNFFQAQVKKISQNRYVHFIGMPILLYLVLFVRFRVDNPCLISIIVALVVLLASQNPKNSLLENKIMKQLGKMSYGIYMYHSTVIILTLYACNSLNVFKMGYPQVLVNTILYVVIFTLSILVATISWNYFEKPITDKK